MEKRIFIAVDISPRARRETAAYIEKLKRDFSNVKVGWDRAEKLHLTLKFLGDTNEETLEKVKQITERAAELISNLKLRISRTGVFPAPRKARVLWLGVEGDTEKLRTVNSFLETECAALGFKKEDRNYSPHLTIGRIREPDRAAELVKVHLELGFAAVEFEVPEIAVYESDLRPAGSIYTKIFAAQIGK